MDLQLKDKVALVSGSTAGIGLAIAKTLAREGARVVINGRTSARVEAALKAIRSEVPEAQLIGVAADLGSAEGCGRMKEEVPTVDILVNNLGIFEPKPFEEIPDEDWTRFFEVNVLSGVRLTRSYLGAMKEKGWGRILFISSESALQIPAEMIHYGMTKTAQVAIARGLAEATMGTGVTVNSILVGPTASEGVGTFVQQLAEQKGQSAEEFEKEFFRSVRPTSLVQRFLTTDEIAAVVAFACSPVAAAVSGTALRAEGGLLKGAF